MRIHTELGTDRLDSSGSRTGGRIIRIPVQQARVYDHATVKPGGPETVPVDGGT